MTNGAKPTKPPVWAKLADKIARKLDADILLFSGAIYAEADDILIPLVAQKKRRKNIVLMLTSYGGQADAAYKIARCLREEYKNGEFILYVDSMCKSAGTLIALGAHQIVMSDQAELGPLDVQVYKQDEVGEFASGLTPIQALSTLRAESFKLWEDHFKKLRYRYTLSTRLAASIAARMAIGMFRSIYEQIDPMRLGENERAMMIGYHYGQRLKTTNLKGDTIDQLLVSYPSHGFVIDRTEARKLFVNVREPTIDEERLAHLVQPIVKAGQANEVQSGPAKILFLSTITTPTSDKLSNGDSNDSRTRKPRKATTRTRANRGTTSRNGRSQPAPFRTRRALPSTATNGKAT